MADPGLPMRNPYPAATVPPAGLGTSIRIRRGDEVGAVSVAWLS